MKEDREFIDDLFKTHLESQSFDVPGDFISDVVNRIEEKKKSKKRKLIIIFFMSCFLFILGVVILFPDKKENNNLRLTNKKEVKAIIKQKNEKKNTFTEKKANSIKKKSILVKTSVSKILSNNNSVMNKSKINHHKKRMKTSTELKENLPNNSNSTIQTIPIQNEKTDGNYESENVTIENLTSENSLDSSSIKKSEQNDSTSVALDKNNTEKNDLSKPSKKSDVSEMKFRDIQIYSGYQINLMDKNSRNNATVNNIEYNLASNFSFGINTQLTHKKIVFGSGFELTQWKENFSWKQQDLILVDSLQVNLNIPIPYATDTTGSSFYNVKLNEVIYYYQTQSKQYNLSNKLTIIQIPLYFGYKMNFHEFDLIPKVGINVGIIRGDNLVQIPSFNSTIISNTSVPNSPFLPFERNRFIGSFQVGVDVRKKFKNWYLFANPYYRNGITSLIQNDRKSVIQFGCNFGIGVIY